MTSRNGWTKWQTFIQALIVLALGGIAHWLFELSNTVRMIEIRQASAIATRQANDEDIYRRIGRLQSEIDKLTDRYLGVYRPERK